MLLLPLLSCSHEAAREKWPRLSSSGCHESCMGISTTALPSRFMQTSGQENDTAPAGLLPGYHLAETTLLCPIVFLSG